MEAVRVTRDLENIRRQNINEFGLFNIWRKRLIED